MSKRPSTQKKLAKLRKSLRRTPDAYIDLVKYLKDRRYAQTTGEAEAIILDGRVKVDGEPIGIVMGEVPVKQATIDLVRGVEPKKEEAPVVQRFVSASLREKLVVD